jgi:hypothetical protein
MLRDVSMMFREDFNQVHLDRAVEEGTRGSMQQLVELANVGTDGETSDFSKLELPAQDVFDVFGAVICANYNTSLDLEHRNAVKGLLSAVVISGKGYYSTNLIKDGRVTFSAMQPYLYRVENGTNSTDYMVSLLPNSTETFGENGAYTRPLAAYPPGVNQRGIVWRINAEVTNALAESVALQGQYLGLDYGLNLASESQLVSDNRVDGPGLMVVLQGLDVGSGADLHSLGFAGYTAIARRRFGGFTDNGIKYYGYLSNIDADITVEHVYESMALAVADGYIPSVKYILG